MAAVDKLTLSIKKTNHEYSKELVYDSLERGKTVDVSVRDIDDDPYNLEGLIIKFIDLKRNSKLVVDSKTSLFDRVDDHGGRFRYTFPDQVYASSGWAKFEFWKDDQKIDTTCDFHIAINQYDDSMVPEDSDYVSALDKLEQDFKDAIDNSKKQSDDLTGKVLDAKKQVDQLITDTKKALAQVTGESSLSAKDYADLKKKLAELKDLADKLNNDSAIFDKLQKEIDAVTKEVAVLKKTNVITRFDRQDLADDYFADHDQGIVIVNLQGEKQND